MHSAEPFYCKTPIPEPQKLQKPNASLGRLWSREGLKGGHRYSLIGRVGKGKRGYGVFTQLQEHGCQEKVKNETL